jgi:succinate dehydrogenase/fumarate reductase flavoprotein subunit
MSLIPAERPPFYALERRVAERDLPCIGLHIDADARVYAEKGGYVSGLFAAGEAASGVFNHYVASGYSIASCVIFGRVAGRSAAVSAKAVPFKIGRANRARPIAVFLAD